MKEAKEFLFEYLKENDTVVLAISGGPDSMALFDVVLEFRKEVPISIICAHVNHKIRIESDSEASFVKEYCDKNNVIFEYKELIEYKTEKFSEANAREKRYDFFDKVIKKYSAKYLLTAHHGDDLMESILMRIVRGSTLKGYSGFSSCSSRDNYKILRPFLSETKESIIAYLKEKNINYVIDNSNNSTNYTRNRYRMNILPHLKDENNMVHLKFLSFSNELLEVEDFINQELSKYEGTIYSLNKINLDEFSKIPLYMKKRILMKVLFDYYKEDIYKITDKHINIILSSLEKYNNQVFLPNGVVFNKHGNKLFLYKFSESIPYEFIFNDDIDLPNGMHISKIDESDINTNYYCRLSKDKVKFPLKIRTRKNGDKMTVKNMEGMKKINDIFTDLKIPSECRDIWPILVDSDDNILWLPGLKESKFDIEKDCNCDIILKYY